MGLKHRAYELSNYPRGDLKGSMSMKFIARTYIAQVYEKESDMGGSCVCNTNFQRTRVSFDNLRAYMLLIVHLSGISQEILMQMRRGHRKETNRIEASDTVQNTKDPCKDAEIKSHQNESMQRRKERRKAHVKWGKGYGGIPIQRPTNKIHQS
jgi:hypothetical protein